MPDNAVTVCLLLFSGRPDCFKPHAGVFQMSSSGLDLLLSLGGHVTSVLTCDMSDNMCVTASLDGVVKTSSLLLPS